MFNMEGKPQENDITKTADKSPFVGLEKSFDIIGISADFYELPRHPELIVRKCFVSKRLIERVRNELSAPEYKKLDPEKMKELTRKKKMEQMIKNAGEFEKMGEQYHLRMAKTNYIVGNDPVSGERAIFAVTDRISGETNLNKMSAVPKELEGEIDEMYAGFFLHLRDSYLENGTFWRDFKNSQVMCGTKYGEKEQHAYIIDVDPVMGSWFEFKQPEHKKIAKERPMEYREWSFWEEIEITLLNLKRVEEKSSSKKFEKAREVVKDIIKDTRFPEPKSKGAKEKYEFIVDEIKN